MAYIDAHNHLHEERFDPMREDLIKECLDQKVQWSVVNGSSPSDWPQVLELARKNSFVVPSFGVHPWHCTALPADWKDRLLTFLDAIPSGVGEVGIDGWRKEFDPELQERVFLEQLQIAAERDLPLSIHGLRKWGRLLELLTKHPRPRCGFLLHSYGGPVEMIEPFAKLGGYFSCPGFFLKPGREMKLRVFAEIPEDRLLLETDAPDQNLPEDLDRYTLTSPSDGARLNHPANIIAVYAGVAALRNVPVPGLVAQVERNFDSLFGGLLSRR
jgi:TatD DNase family protein